MHSQSLARQYAIRCSNPQRDLIFTTIFSKIHFRTYCCSVLYSQSYLIRSRESIASVHPSVQTIRNYPANLWSLAAYVRQSIIQSRGSPCSSSTASVPGIKLRVCLPLPCTNTMASSPAAAKDGINEPAVARDPGAALGEWYVQYLSICSHLVIYISDNHLIRYGNKHLYYTFLSSR